jgi:predicted permease
VGEPSTRSGTGGEVTGRRLIVRFLEWFLPPEDRDEIIGDLDEQFVICAQDHGERYARQWYRRQALDLIWRYRRDYHLEPGVTRRTGAFALGDDVRHVLRRLRANRSAAAVTMGLLAAAIALSTSTFAVLDSLVLERAPFANADRLRTIAIRRIYGGDDPELIKLIRAWRAAGIFEAVEAAGVEPLASKSATSSITSAVVTPGLFRMLGVAPIIGRQFTDDDAKAGGPEPVMISEGFWSRTLSGDHSRLDQPISIDGREYRVIGVMPADFRFPSAETVIWRPLSIAATPFPASASRYAYVRLPRGIPEGDVLASAARISAEADPRFIARPNELSAAPIGGTIDGYAGRAIPLFAVAVGLIFLALCANASTLLLTQMTTRRRELGIRLALGASPSRLLRECAIEHAIVGAAAAAIGIWLAGMITAAAPRFLGQGFDLTESLNPINLDPRALLVASTLGFVAVLIAGMLPAWIGTRVNPSVPIKPADRTHTESGAARAMARAMLVAQMAFASMLIIGGALLCRTFERMANADRGMDARGVHTLTAFMSSVAPGVLDDLESRIRGLHGVEQATVDGAAPPEAGRTMTERWQAGSAEAIEFPIKFYEVRPQFFDFYGITLLKGRRFEPADPATVAIVGERVAALLWPNQDPLGKPMTTEGRSLQFQVIGVAREITLPSLSEGVDLPEIYAPFSGRRRVVTASWRCFTACPDRQQMTAVVRQADPKAEVIHGDSTEQRYARQLVRPRAAAQLGATFAAVAFVTSGAGLFAVLSAAVARRRREFGIRIALGATPAILSRDVVGHALGFAAIGAAVGGLAAWSLQRSLESLVYGISPRDPFTWLTMVAVIAATALVAAWHPCRRAARVDPVALLREE